MLQCLCVELIGVDRQVRIPTGHDNRYRYVIYYPAETSIGLFNRLLSRVCSAHQYTAVARDIKKRKNTSIKKHEHKIKIRAPPYHISTVTVPASSDITIPNHNPNQLPPRIFPRYLHTKNIKEQQQEVCQGVRTYG